MKQIREILSDTVFRNVWWDHETGSTALSVISALETCPGVATAFYDNTATENVEIPLCVGGSLMWVVGLRSCQTIHPRLQSG
jgi:hypothetical protein